MKRILLTLAVTAGFLLSLALPATATPIRPDLQKILAEPQQAAVQFPPARAGWQGSEMATSTPSTNPGVAVLRQASAANAARASLIAAALPDPRILLLIGLAILLLRRLRKKQPA